LGLRLRVQKLMGYEKLIPPAGNQNFYDSRRSKKSDDIEIVHQPYYIAYNIIYKYICIVNSSKRKGDVGEFTNILYINIFLKRNQQKAYSDDETFNISEAISIQIILKNVCNAYI
jgi:hypothetical protein